MLNDLGTTLGRKALSNASYHEAKTFELFDLEWEKYPEIFGSLDVRGSTAYLTSCLPYEEGTAFLEMGCGAGVTAVVAALRGCDPVTALDINPAAVRNTRANARRHGMGGRVRAMRSDLFQVLEPNDRFDLIYWNAPYIEAPAGALGTFDEYVLFDPGYSMHRTFLHTAHQHLTEQGRVFMGFSAAAGNMDLIHEIADEADLTCSIYEQETADVSHQALGTAPAYAAHADSKGMVQLDMTLLAFVQN